MGSKKAAAKNKKLTAEISELRTTLTGVRGQLTKTSAKLAKVTAEAERWKIEAKDRRLAASIADARAKRLQKKLDRASQASEPVPPETPVKTAASETAAAVSTSARSVKVPDQTWTVLQLRAEARARGLRGMSNKPKSQLLAVLT